MTSSLSNKKQTDTGIPLQFLSAAFILTIFLFLTMAWFHWSLHKEVEGSHRKAHAIIELKGTILQYSELLTMSAKMASSTGNLYWEERYRTLAAQQDRAIKELVRIAPAAFSGEAAATTDAATLKLVAMENQAFTLTRRGKTLEAASLLNSSEYEHEKYIYTAGMQQLKRHLDGAAEQLLDQEHKRGLGAIMTIAIAIPLLLFIWSATHQKIRLYIVRRRQDEQGLKESEAQLQTLLQSIRAGVVVHDRDTKITRCNRAAQELLGLTEGQMLGKEAIDHSWNFCTKDEQIMPLSDYPVTQVLNSKTALENFIVGINKANSDERTWVLVNAVPEYKEDGEIARVIVTFMDISERRQTEQERKKLVEELQKALSEIKTLQGIIPICSHCHKIRNDKGYWQQVDQYISEHSEAEFSHGICTDCFAELYGDQEWYERVKKETEQ
ncbi:PAS domain S-box protein [Desulfogranum mediterraneum]|uniref:PAS domain S-box protein n=1 Tax=Desulfogranum mediterraneum TaxID=160661 RepID=UPI0004086DED|nr:PAS domain-containing protein [Desulfogranum mediterraneum]